MALIIKWSVTAIKTANYMAAWGELVRCDPSGGAFTVTLPTAAGNAGRRLMVKNVTSDTTAITVDGNSSETVDGSANISMATAWKSVTLVSDGTNILTE